MKKVLLTQQSEDTVMTNAGVTALVPLLQRHPDGACPHRQTPGKLPRVFFMSIRSWKESIPCPLAFPVLSSEDSKQLSGQPFLGICPLFSMALMPEDQT